VMHVPWSGRALPQMRRRPRMMRPPGGRRPAGGEPMVRPDRPLLGMILCSRCPESG
jgi:hypothetical protein